MATYDQWPVPDYDRTPPNYNQGETITVSVSVSGTVRKTEDPGTVIETQTLSLILQASDGATETVAPQPVQVTRTVAGSVTFLPATILSVTDSAGRTYTVAADGLSASAIA